MGETVYTYTWTETASNYVGTTYRINAAQPIKIKTTDKTEPTINITNAGHITIDGDLGAGVADGTINITSKYGKIITSDNGKITDAKVNLKAKENIEVTLGAPENKTTTLKATSTDVWNNADIKINANSSLKDIDISGSKNLNIVGLDDISGNISSQNLEITTPGNVNIKTKVSDKITIQGDKSVQVTQSDGDIKVGKITSKGDVTLTASNGAIVNSVDTAFNMTGAADKIDAWRAAGLINDKDSDDSAINAAQEDYRPDYHGQKYYAQCKKFR